MRAPIATDDTTKGYAVGDYWYSSGNNLLYKALAVTANAAVWFSVQPVSQFVLDTVTGAKQAYGVIKLRAAYAGMAFQVKRASDSVAMDIPFTSAGIADFAMVDAFAEGTSAYVSIWYDQAGVGPYNAVGAPGPSASIGNDVNGVRSLTGADTANALTASTPSYSRQALSVIDVSYPVAPGLSNGLSPTQLFKVGGATFATGSVDENGQFSITTEGSPVAFEHQSAHPAVRIITSSAARSRIAVNGRQGADKTALATGTLSGLVVGDATNISSFVDRLAFIVYDSTLTDANSDKVAQWALQQFKISPTPPQTLLILADSFGTGKGSFAAQPWSRQMKQYLSGRPFKIRNHSTINQTAAYFDTNSAVFTTSEILPTGQRNLVVIALGKKDLDGGATAAATYAHIVNIVTAMKATGAKVLVATLMPSSLSALSGAGLTLEPLRQALNVLIRANTAGADDVIDMGADGTMGEFANTSKAVYFEDGELPSFYGYQLMAQKYAAVINKW